MVTSLEITSFAEKNVKLPLFTGYIARGLALHMIRAVNPLASQDLHEPNMVKPYSVTPLYFRSVEKFFDGYNMDASNPCSFKIRFLDDMLAKNVIEYIASNESMMILDTVFKITAMTAKSENFAKISDSKIFRIVFNTPTHLSNISSKFDRVFPEPLVVFPNLMRVWDSCMSEKFGKDIHAKYKIWLEENVTVSAYDLRTLAVYNRKSMKIGFVGWSTYRIGCDSEFSLITNKLAKFAEYSNIGMERTAGFGVVHYYNNQHK